MADAEHLACLKQGPSVWNKWRRMNPNVSPNLCDAGQPEAELGDTVLAGANLRGADLSRAKLGNRSLAGTALQQSILSNADLSGATGVQAPQLAGADLSGAQLPGSLADLFQSLDTAKAISGNAQKLFVAMQAACLYSWLTIATTTDVNLITNRASSPLPVIQTSIPIVAFYAVTPLLLLGVYFYFHFYLQKLWEELGTLPAIFPDGRPLQTKADPWLLSDLVRAHLPKLNSGRPFLSYLQQWISILLAWWMVPITLLIFWARYLRRHDPFWTITHAGLTAVSIAAALSLYRLAAGTLRGEERIPFRWPSALSNRRAYRPVIIALACTAVLAFVSLAAIHGVLVPRLMTALRYSPYADLRAADLSIKPPNWTGKSDSELDSVRGIQLTNTDLRSADLEFAFLATAVLSDAHMEGADLFLADLRRAELAGAHFDHAELLGARLEGADLVGAHLSGADLTGASFTGADVRYADFRGAKGLLSDQLQAVQNYDQAFYDATVLAALNLKPGNNDAVAERRKQEEDAANGNPAAAEAARLERRARQLGKTAEASVVIGLIRSSISEGSTLQRVSTTVPTTAETGGTAGAGSVAGPRSFTVKEVMRLYSFPDKLDGSGEIIGTIELGSSYRQSDLTKYFSGQGIQVPKISIVSVDGAANPPPSLGDSQAELDIEVAGTAAPKAEFVAYQAPNTNQGFVDAITKATNDSAHRLSVLLIDWGAPESTWASQGQAMNQALQQAAQAGITVVVAAGDNGVTDGAKDSKPHVDFPASSPWVLAVGGTKLIGAGNSIASEVVWNDGNNQGATGGGVSAIFPRPEWQAALSVPRRADGTTGRGIPDVAANASPTTGYKLFVTGQAAVLGGTSVAAPLWAGLVALLNQGTGRRIGYLNPFLYQHAGPGGALRPITTGDNSYEGVPGFHAGASWSAVTGWGSPDGKKLLEALQAMGAAHN